MLHIVHPFRNIKKIYCHAIPFKVVFYIFDMTMSPFLFHPSITTVFILCQSQYFCFFSILILRNSSDEIPHKRNSKVLSWSDLSTQSKEEKVPEKRSTSAGEITCPIQIISPLISPIQITTPEDVTTPAEPESKSSGYVSLVYTPRNANRLNKFLYH